MKHFCVFFLCAALSMAADFTTGQAARAVIGQTTFTGALAGAGQSLIGAAVTDAVEGFCVIRRPRNPDRVASPAGAAAKQTPSPDATAQPANTATAR